MVFIVVSMHVIAYLLSIFVGEIQKLQFHDMSVDYFLRYLNSPIVHKYKVSYQCYDLPIYHFHFATWIYMSLISPVFCIIKMLETCQQISSYSHMHMHMCMHAIY